MDDNMKRLDKIKAHRQKRAARRGRAHAESGERRAAPSPVEQMPEE